MSKIYFKTVHPTPSLKQEVTLCASEGVSFGAIFWNPQINQYVFYPVAEINFYLTYDALRQIEEKIIELMKKKRVN